MIWLTMICLKLTILSSVNSGHILIGFWHTFYIKIESFHFQRNDFGSRICFRSLLLVDGLINEIGIVISMILLFFFNSCSYIFASLSLVLLSVIVPHIQFIMKLILSD